MLFLMPNQQCQSTEGSQSTEVTRMTDFARLLSLSIAVCVCSDMSKPINVLTGIDYWLDNLMCNVPELAMCYHDNGIVQVSLARHLVSFSFPL